MSLSVVPTIARPIPKESIIAHTFSMVDLAMRKVIKSPTIVICKLTALPEGIKIKPLYTNNDSACCLYQPSNANLIKAS